MKVYRLLLSLVVVVMIAAVIFFVSIPGSFVGKASGFLLIPLIFLFHYLREKANKIPEKPDEPWDL